MRILPGINISDWLKQPMNDFVFFYYIMIGQILKSTDLCLLEEYLFYVSDFCWSSNKATI